MIFFSLIHRFYLLQYDRAGITVQKGDWDPKKRAKEIIAKLDISGDKKLNKQEFVTGYDILN